MIDGHRTTTPHSSTRIDSLLPIGWISKNHQSAVGLKYSRSYISFFLYSFPSCGLTFFPVVHTETIRENLPRTSTRIPKIGKGTYFLFFLSLGMTFFRFDSTHLPPPIGSRSLFFPFFPSFSLDVNMYPSLQMHIEG